MSRPTRRDFVKAAGAASLIVASGLTTELQAREGATMRRAFEYEHVPVPLPFDAKGLRGLSERLIQSHWENNYGGAVQALNIIRGRLTSALNDNSAPPYVFNALKREQGARTGSVVFHELYFENLGGDGSASTDVRSKIASSFGSFDAWETEFRKIGLGLGGGSGWVILGYNQRLGLLENYCLADHANSPAYAEPVLVMDMYEHAYQMDYGAAAAQYIDAFFVNAQWDVVSRRLARLPQP